MKKKSQIQKLIPALKRKYITFLDAVDIAGTTSLHRRLTDIKKMGYKVEDKWITSKSGTRMKAYKIVGGAK